MHSDFRATWPSLRQFAIATGLALATLLLAACQHDAARSVKADAAEANDSTNGKNLSPLSASAGVGGGAVRTDLSSRDIQLPDYVPVRRYQDVFTENGTNRKVYVEYGWDYRRGVSVETVYDVDGKPTRRVEQPGTMLNFTDRELELAIALAREHPQLKSELAADDLNFYAGFVFMESDVPGCGRKSRCVHVIVSAGDGQRHVAHAIVDLMARKVVKPFLDPARMPDPKSGKS